MEAMGDLPRAPDAGTDPPPPLLAAAAAKPKAQRCLGLAPLPRLAAGASPAVPCAANGLSAAAYISSPLATVPCAPAANGNQRRPRRDPSAPAPGKQPGVKKKAPSAPAPPPPSSVDPPLAPAASMEPEASSPAPVPTSALMVLDGMPTSMDDENFMNYTCGDALAMPSQEYTQEDEGEGEGVGFVEPIPKRGRGTNFSQKEDETLCNEWRQIGVDAIVGNEQQSSAYWDCIHELYKLLLKGDMARSASSSVGDAFVVDSDDDGASSPTLPSSVNRGRPDGRKKAKNARANGEEAGYKQSLDNMMETRKDIATQRREMKTKEMEERREAEEKKLAAEEKLAEIEARRAAAEERRAAAEEKLAEIEERKLASEEMTKRLENEQRIMFMDPSGLDEKARAYLEICRDQILAAKGYYPKNGGNGDGAI